MSPRRRRSRHGPLAVHGRPRAAYPSSVAKSPELRALDHLARNGAGPTRVRLTGGREFVARDAVVRDGVVVRVVRGDGLVDFFSAAEIVSIEDVGGWVHIETGRIPGPPHSDAIDFSGDFRVNGVRLASVIEASKFVAGEMAWVLGRGSVARQFTLREPPALPGGRVPLWLCRCGDPACGYTAVRVTREDHHFVWDDLIFGGGPDPAECLDPPLRPLRFPETEYRDLFARL